MSELPALAGLAARRRSLLLRVHCWAALIASPFILVATLTGLVYVFTPQVEARLYAHLERVEPRGARLPLDASVAAAQQVAGAGLALRTVTPPHAPGDPVRVGFEPAQAHAGGAHHHAPAADPAAAAQGATPLTVFVDPYDARVLGSQVPDERFSEWARTLHSRLLQGEGWRWMIELGASWLFVMLLSGVVLWWPGRTRAFLPRRGKTGRAAWRQWHAFAGVSLGILSLVMVATGITWSQYAGDRVRQLRDAAGQASPQVPRHLHSTPLAGAASLNWQQAWQHARETAPAVAMQLRPPQGAQGVWRATGIDRTRPADRFDLVFDAYSGRTLYRSGWEQQTAFGKATALGIPFHRGEFGIWNQVLLFLFGAGVLCSLVSGWGMFFRRRRAGRQGAPPLLPTLLPALLPGSWRSVSPVAVASALALCALIPLLALSAAVVLALEWMMSRGDGRGPARA
ncbi:PepSY-associated TM helix domain-containing protein [Massilia sp. SYSU DXS3249]